MYSFDYRAVWPLLGLECCQFSLGPLPHDDKARGLPRPSSVKSAIWSGNHFYTVEVLSWKSGVPGHETSMVSFTASPGGETKELTVSLEALGLEMGRGSLWPSRLHHFLFLRRKACSGKREPHCETAFLLSL